ncbi:hypothetical protein Tco_0838773 [Tanacetum coccineum]|uniref:Uncharacterized protein n=1 Tax=Tanacetum coccineum TaxID=301880 RepID=A0ABQ5ANS7_9ASTR
MHTRRWEVQFLEFNLSKIRSLETLGGGSGGSQFKRLLNNECPPQDHSRNGDYKAGTIRSSARPRKEYTPSIRFSEAGIDYPQMEIGGKVKAFPRLENGIRLMLAPEIAMLSSSSSLEISQGIRNLPPVLQVFLGPTELDGMRYFVSKKGALGPLSPRVKLASQLKKSVPDPEVEAIACSDPVLEVIFANVSMIATLALTWQELGAYALFSSCLKEQCFGQYYRIRMRPQYLLGGCLSIEAIVRVSAIALRMDLPEMGILYEEFR